MPRKQASNSVSAIAGKYARMTNEEMAHIATGSIYRYAKPHPGLRKQVMRADEFFRDVRKLAASYLPPKSKQEKPIRKRPSVDV